MTNIRTTAKSIIVRYNEFRVTNRQTGETRVGAADVSYSLDEFKKSAAHYGWGEVQPTDLVGHTEQPETYFEVLVGSIQHCRVNWV